MRNARGALSLLLVLAAGLVWAPSARADSQARIVRLSLVSGPVQIDRGQGFEKAIMNMPVAQGMKLWAQGDSRAEVEFEDGATMRLTPGAKVEFEQLTLLSDGAKASTIRVNGGSVYFNTPHKGNNDFRVAFGDRQLRLTHSVRFRLDLTSDKAEIAVFKGELALDGPKESKLKKNETAVEDLGGKGTYQVAKGITPGQYDSWDAYRIEYENTYASTRYSNLPYYYGRSDLNYYGSWGYVPGYGNLWRPFGVGYGWDPFYNGAWAWYPGWGYTWVSGYPWGWIPYRYGSWLWVPNYGWCWRSGPYTNWAAVPPVINPPPAYNPPHPPPVTSGPGSNPPPTVIVRNPRIPGLPRIPVDAKGEPIILDGDTARVGAKTTVSPGVTGPAATSGTTALATSTAAPAPAAVQPARPVRTFVPKSGPGMGRLPAPMDDTGIATVRGGGARVHGDGAFRSPSMPGRTSAPPMRSGGSGPHTGGSHPAAPSAAPRVSAPPSAPRAATPSGVAHSTKRD